MPRQTIDKNKAAKINKDLEDGKLGYFSCIYPNNLMMLAEVAVEVQAQQSSAGTSEPPAEQTEVNCSK